jgi:hypothetical protein
VVILDVKLVPSFDEDKAGAHPLRFADLSASFYAKGFGLITGGDGASGVGHYRNNSDRVVAKLGTQLLLDGGKVGVEIKKEPANWRRIHG